MSTTISNTKMVDFLLEYLTDPERGNIISGHGFIVQRAPLTASILYDDDRPYVLVEFDRIGDTQPCWVFHDKRLIDGIRGFCSEMFNAAILELMEDMKEGS